MTEQATGLGTFGHAGDDNVVPFQVDSLDVRGRTVQLGPMLDAILGRHDYPDEVALLLAEAITLTALLGTSLKFSGKFIFQTQTDGPVDMLVADFSTPDAMRAYARFDAGKVAEARAAGKTRPEELMGKGILALTVDQGAHTQRYQGIVQLDGSTLEEVARKYFLQSEQIPTAIRLAAGRQLVTGEGISREVWRAGGIVAQFLPDAPERMRMPDLHGGDGDDGRSSHSPDDAWREAEVLLATIEPTELWDPTVGAELLLYRLFHEHGVTVYPTTSVLDKCSCSREKIGGILRGFSAEEVSDSIENGKIRVDCEFCSTRYEFDPAEIASPDTSGD